MALILRKIQYPYIGILYLESGEIPYYEKNGKFYLKETNEEITVKEEEIIIL